MTETVRESIGRTIDEVESRRFMSLELAIKLAGDFTDIDNVLKEAAKIDDWVKAVE